MADSDTPPLFPTPDITPSLQQMQRWTQNIGQAQQLLMEHAANNMTRTDAAPPLAAALSPPEPAKPFFDFLALGKLQAEMAQKSIELWQQFANPGSKTASDASAPPPMAHPMDQGAINDKRLADPAWAAHPFFDLIRRSYLLVADYMLRLSDTVDGLDPKQKAQLRFATKGFAEALSPANFPFTNPQVIEKTLETGGENLVKGLQHLLRDLEKGQLTQTDTSAFELGVNIAATPGKVIKETPLYQLIQYEPTTPKVYETPLIIFPPWINRFYILDLAPQKSFVKWAVDQGLTVFMVSWKSADASMKDVCWDDYILRGQVDAIDTVRDLLGVPDVHAIGYCVAGTTLAATLALLAARGQADKVASATFFTAQVDFSEAGELQLFIDDEHLKLVEQLSAPGYLDGRYMAATFNLLRGQDLIWSYVVDNYLLGKEYKPFDLLYWNGDTTNLPARWHREYLTNLYRDNKLVVPGAIKIDGTPIDLRKIRTPSYIQAGKEDHIAPLNSVWKATEHFSGPIRFLLAGSGHIAGVINPPASNKYGYWTNDKPLTSLDAFIAGAKETAGSWWPDWLQWVTALAPEQVAAKGARKPGKGKLPAIEDAPGRYVRTR